MRVAFADVIVAVTAFLATYYFLTGEQQGSSLAANRSEFTQESARAEKSDRLETSDRLEAVEESFIQKIVRLVKFERPADDHSVHPSYLAYYVYSEIPPDKRPADVVLDSLKDVPVGTPIEEIKRASDAFGLDVNFMKAVAKIESDFDPKQRTGSYSGLFQLSNYEFAKYGSGNIFNARDNAIAAANKFASSALLFELNTHRKATISDLYLIHQQGTQGAEEHVNHPDWIAWKSMCATDEGKEKGQDWCKRAIWGNTLPEVKHVWKTVDNLTSAAFLKMWQGQVDRFYTRYSEEAAATN
ncbi:MAG: transglycosylase [Xanthobacteraceae bacterium]|jgi:hypothetical protein